MSFDPLLALTWQGHLRLRPGVPPEPLVVRSGWGPEFAVLGGTVFCQATHDPRDEWELVRYRASFLPTGATEGTEFAEAKIVVGAPDEAEVWLVEPAEGVARRADPRTGEVRGEVPLPPGGRVVGAAAGRLVLTTDDPPRVTVWDPVAGAETFSVPGELRYPRSRYAVLRRDGRNDVLDLATGEVRRGGLSDVSRPAVSPDGRWLIGAVLDQVRRVSTVRALDLASGRTVTPLGGRFRLHHWPEPSFSWSRDGRTVYVVPQERLLTMWRPGDLSMRAISDLPAYPVLPE